jgi:hypothetical protein
MSTPQWLRELGIPEDCISPASSTGKGEPSFVILPQAGDQIWRVEVDHCWFGSREGKRVDYLFWGQSASVKRVILLVELKGKKFKDALEQIENTLRRLCKLADGNGIHTGPHRHSPGHALHTKGGVRAYVVSSKGKGVPQRLKEQGRILERYGVFVHTKSQHLQVNDLDNLP